VVTGLTGVTGVQMTTVTHSFINSKTNYCIILTQLIYIEMF